MSFFDEADEPPRTEVRTPSRPASRRRPSPSRSGGSSGSGGSRGGGPGRRRAAGGGSVRTRQAVAIGTVIVAIILIAVGVSSCESSSRKSALQDYANDVHLIVSDSDATGRRLFTVLRGAAAANDPTSVSNRVNAAGAQASAQLVRARHLSAPSSGRTAEADLVRALQMRADGISAIADEIQPALGKSASRDAIEGIAAQMARFYASDVLYKDYVVPAVVSALHANGIAVGDNGGIPVVAGQFLPSIGWLDPNTVASTLGARGGGGSSPTGKATSGLHGHTLDAVSVDGTTLESGATNDVSSSPTFTLEFTNGGTTTENNVVCKVTVTGTGVSGTKTVSQTSPGEAASCAVTLSGTVPAGTYSVVATVEPVPGEKTISNNTRSYPVAFR